MRNYRRFSRYGIATKGFVFTLIGLMALITAFNLTKSVRSEEAALRWIYDQTLGSVLLIAIIVGLSGYIFSRIILAFNQKDYDGSKDKPLVRRIGYFVNAIGYLLLLTTCFSILLDISSRDPGWTKVNILHSAVGKVFVYMVALGLVIRAINEWWICFSNVMDQQVLQDELSHLQYKVLLLTGRFGRFNRGIVFSVFAYILARSAYLDLDNLPKGAYLAFTFINAALGAYVMGFIAFGIICYGTFLITGAKHRNIPIA